MLEDTNPSDFRQEASSSSSGPPSARKLGWGFPNRPLHESKQAEEARPGEDNVDFWLQWYRVHTGLSHCIKNPQISGVENKVASVAQSQKKTYAINFRTAREDASSASHDIINWHF